MIEYDGSASLFPNHPGLTGIKEIIMGKMMLKLITDSQGKTICVG
jgi:hypothetical protein